MIRSMTGYGAAESIDDQVRIAVEIRTVNNRFFKVNLRTPDGLGAMEVTVERLLRDCITRGTISVNVSVEPRGAAVRAPINTDILTAYYNDLAPVAKKTGFAISLEALMSLPGVLGAEKAAITGIENLPAKIEAAVKQAAAKLNAMRDTEGRATADDMRRSLDEMERRIAAVQVRVPAVIAEYRERLRQRVKEILEDAEVAADDGILAREVAFAAERSDINEELARLSSHIAQYRELLDESGPAGRKLEFLTQEMYREVNTLGSKANDSEISREVVEIKVGVDRLREQSLNVE
jgi:uncharacterized protein (TIGR00255 family)